MSKPVEDLALVVKLAQEREKLGSMLGRVRKLHESDEFTLERLISERHYVVGLIDAHFEDRENNFKLPYDPHYSDFFKGAITNVVATTRYKALHDALQAVREVMDGENESRPGHVMAVIVELMEKAKSENSPKRF